MLPVRKSNFALAYSMLALILGAQASVSFAAGQILYETNILTVAVNGGADSTNPGTSCIQVTSAVSATCQGGFVAILNNNKQLIAAALLNKATMGKIILYYEDSSTLNQCPGFATTPCVVNTILSK
ncbi:MAG TPA: hypothetical protein VLA61_01020 [Ideonella sp.]|uniref:hypothetical protein n=1 Tax=Ideonella sp. TaxID=1929293 RepID=UPI002C0C8BB3|nr:hypothetical protein [Ideonella sp.]HSI46832.1 hypothetical protein [Ideonella sp.]